MPKLAHFDTAALLEKERRYFSPKQMALVHGVSYEAMRQRLCYHGITAVAQAEGEALVLKLWHRGSPEEIAEFMDLDHGILVGHLLRMGLIDALRQLALWPIVRVPVLRIVHTKKRDLEVMPLSLFDPINTGIIEGTERFIGATGNDIVQLYAAAQ